MNIITGRLGGDRASKRPFRGAFFQNVNVNWARMHPDNAQLIPEGTLLALSEPNTVRNANPEQIIPQKDGHSLQYAPFEDPRTEDPGICGIFLGITPYDLTNNPDLRPRNRNTPTRMESVITFAASVEPDAYRGEIPIQVGQLTIMGPAQTIAVGQEAQRPNRQNRVRYRDENPAAPRITYYPVDWVVFCPYPELQVQNGMLAADFFNQQAGQYRWTISMWILLLSALHFLGMVPVANFDLPNGVYVRLMNHLTRIGVLGVQNQVIANRARLVITNQQDFTRSTVDRNLLRDEITLLVQWGALPVGEYRDIISRGFAFMAHKLMRRVVGVAQKSVVAGTPSVLSVRF